MSAPDAPDDRDDVAMPDDSGFDPETQDDVSMTNGAGCDPVADPDGDETIIDVDSDEDKELKSKEKEFSKTKDRQPWWARTLGEWVEPATLDEKRALYACGNDFVTLADIPTWTDYCRNGSIPRARPDHVKAPVNPEINAKVSLHFGTITAMEVDAIVNAANSSLLGGGGIDGAIHRAAGRHLLQECRTLRGCSTGDTKLTRGYKLPAKYVLHTVGPMGSGDASLLSSYRTTLNLVETTPEIRTVALCCVSTGIYGFPLARATKIALAHCREWLEAHHSEVDRVIFCVFLEKERRIYEHFLPHWFPVFTEDDADDIPLQPEHPPEPKRSWWGGGGRWSWKSQPVDDSSSGSDEENEDGDPADPAEDADGDVEMGANDQSDEPDDGDMSVDED